MEQSHFAFYKLCWIPVGRGALEFGTSRLPLGKDELLLTPVDDEHRFVDNPSAPLTLAFVHFSEQVVNESKPLKTIMLELRKRFDAKYPVVCLGSYRKLAVQDTFKRMLIEQSRGGPGSTSILHVGLIDLLVHLLRGETVQKSASISREQALEGTLEYIEDFFHKPIRVKDLAEMCGISSRRYSDLFKQRTGKTIVEYLSDRRVAYAKERLRDTGQITYAAVAAGFSDVTHFYRVFKRIAGITPGAFVEGLTEKQSKKSEPSATHTEGEQPD